MRYRTEAQEKLYQYYLNIGNQYTGHEKWDAISKSGIWKLPIEKQFGGEGLNWDDCLSALEGLVSSGCDISFISNLVSQYTSLYLVNKYAKYSLKKKYLLLLMKGNLSAFVIKPDVLQPNSIFCSKEEPEITIAIRRFRKSKANNRIAFYISNKSRKVEKSLVVAAKKFVITQEETGLAFCDFINMQKIIYGVLVANSMSRLIGSYKNNKEIGGKLNEIIKNINISKDSMYQSLNINDSRELKTSLSFSVH